MYKEILEASAEYYTISVEDIKSKCRERDLVRIKCYVSALMKDIVPDSKWVEIAKIMNAHHSTIMHRVNLIEEESEIYPEVRKEYKKYCEYVMSKITSEVDLGEIL